MQSCFWRFSRSSWGSLFIISAIAGCLVLPFSCSRRDSQTDTSPAAPPAPYKLSVSAEPTKLYANELSLIMIDVKNFYGEELNESVVVNLRTTGGLFVDNGERQISRQVFNNGSLWLKYDPAWDEPGDNTVTAIIDYSCKDSYVSDSVDILFLGVEHQVSFVDVESSPEGTVCPIYDIPCPEVVTSTCPSAPDFAIIIARVKDDEGNPMAGVAVAFSLELEGLARAALDELMVNTDQLGEARTILRSNGDSGGVAVVRATAGAKTDYVRVRVVKCSASD